ESSELSRDRGAVSCVHGRRRSCAVTGVSTTCFVRTMLRVVQLGTCQWPRPLAKASGTCFPTLQEPVPGSRWRAAEPSTRRQSRGNFKFDRTATRTRQTTEGATPRPWSHSRGRCGEDYVLCNQD